MTECRLRDGPRLPRRRARAQDLHDDVHRDRVGRRLLSQARHGRPAVLELRGDLPIREAAHLRGGVLHLAVTQNGHRHGNSMATSTTPSANRPRAEQQIGGGGGNRTGVRKHSVWWGRLPRARAPNRGVVMQEATALGFSWREEIRWRCHRRTTVWQLLQVSLPPRTDCRPLSLDRDVLKPLAVELSAALA